MDWNLTALMKLSAFAVLTLDEQSCAKETKGVWRFAALEPKDGRAYA